jgi:hypothetical protein
MSSHSSRNRESNASTYPFCQVSRWNDVQPELTGRAFSCCDTNQLRCCHEAVPLDGYERAPAGQSSLAIRSAPVMLPSTRPPRHSRRYPSMKLR